MKADRHEGPFVGETADASLSSCNVYGILDGNGRNVGRSSICRSASSGGAYPLNQQRSWVQCGDGYHYGPWVPVGWYSNSYCSTGYYSITGGYQRR